MEAATPAAELAAMLVSLGIADGPAAGYAAALAEDGFDTPASFGTLSLDELQDDFGFKRGHLRMVEKARDALGPVPQTQPAHLTEISTAAEAGAPTAVGIPTAVGVALPTAVGIPITTALTARQPGQLINNRRMPTRRTLQPYPRAARPKLGQTGAQ